MKYFSMFSGIGGFELGIQRAFNQQSASIKQDREGWNGNSDKVEHDVLPSGWTAPLCIGYSEIDKYAISIYEKHFGGQCEESSNAMELRRCGQEKNELETSVSMSISEPYKRQSAIGDGRKGHKNYGNARDIIPEQLPDFDFLCGGFPCQAFSIAGKRGGFEDTRGTLFFEIARILAVKRPQLLLLENVKGLLSHDNGRTFGTILATLSDLGYFCEWQVLNSKDFGVPQNRERVFIVGHLRGECGGQVFPIGKTSENNTGKTNELPVQITNTLRTNYSNGQANKTYTTQGSRIRRLTPTECERLQGFPDGWTEGISDTQRYKCLGNAVTVNVIQAIMEKIYETIR